MMYPDTTIDNITVIGTGSFGRAFAIRLVNSGYHVTFGSRDPARSRGGVGFDVMELMDVPVMDVASSLRQSDIIVLAIPAGALTEFPEGVTSDLFEGKIVIDVTNSLPPAILRKKHCESNAEKLAAMLPSARVVKAFSTISAYALESDVSGERRHVIVCGDDSEAVQRVVHLAETMGFTAGRHGGLGMSRAVEAASRSLFPRWRAPLLLSTIIFLLWFIYALVRLYCARVPPFEWDRLPLNVINKVVCCASITLLAMVFLPNSVSGIVQLYRGTKYRPFPSWLDAWLRMRKELGLISLWLGAVHGVMSVVVLTPAYFTRLFVFRYTEIAVNGSVPQTFSVAADSRLNWAGETTVLLGCLTLGVLALLGISSSPSVSATYSWREFRCCFSSVGFLALLLAATHVTVYGAYHWHFTANVKGIVLSMSMVTLFLPWLTIVLRFVMAMPCFSRQLTRIRHGHVRRDPLSRSFHNRVNHVDVTDNTLKLTETI